MINEQQGIKPYVIGLDLGGTNSVFGMYRSPAAHHRTSGRHRENQVNGHRCPQRQLL